MMYLPLVTYYVLHRGLFEADTDLAPTDNLRGEWIRCTSTRHVDDPDNVWTNIYHDQLWVFWII